MSTTVNTSTTNTVTITEKGSSVQVTENSSCPTTTTISPVESTTVTVSENGIAGPVGPPGLITSNTGAVISGNLTASGDIDAGGVISGSGLLISAAGPSGQAPSYDVKFETTTDNDLNVAFEAGSTGQSHFQIKVRDDVDRLDISSDTVNPAISILDNGSVGIGTSTPAEILEIVGDTKITGDVQFIGANTNMRWDTSTSDLILFDSTRLEFGSNKDFEIWHGGSHTFMKNSGGDLRIRGDVIKLAREDSSERFIECNVNNAVQIFHNGVERFTTTNAGVSVTGDITGSGNLKIDGSEVDFTNLPTSDPGVAGRLWRSGADVKVSI